MDQFRLGLSLRDEGGAEESLRDYRRFLGGSSEPGPQDYAVLPEKSWLDGYCVEESVVRQFVAMPPSESYPAEEQLTGTADHGGLQVVACAMKAERHRDLRSGAIGIRMHQAMLSMCLKLMGLAPAGRIDQKAYGDVYELGAWDQGHGSRCFVSPLNSAQWMAVTGEQPPTAQEYAARGLPWFDYYGGDAQAVAGSARLRGLKGIAKQADVNGKGPLPDNESIEALSLVTLGKPGQVRECTISGVQS